MFAAPRELGWTDAPEALVPEKPSQLWDMSRALQARGDQLNDVADGLRTVAVGSSSARPSLPTTTTTSAPAPAQSMTAPTRARGGRRSVNRWAR
jgi:hypothetical protein